jgi:hypothetical protein
MTTSPLFYVDLPYEECYARNSPDCLLITPSNHMSTYFDQHGEPRLACMNCEPMPVEQLA